MNENATENVIDAPNMIATLIRRANVEPDTAKQLSQQFAELERNAHQCVAGATDIVVTDAAQVSLMKQARERRLEIRHVRIQVEKLRKTLKEDSLRRGQLVDGIARHLTATMEQAEAHLEQQEKFAERVEAQRKEALRLERAQKLAPYGVDTSAMDLASMTEAAFTQVLDGAVAAEQARKDAAEKAERERRWAQEAAERQRREAEEEAARLREENERLAREAAEADAQARAEREAAEKVARAEREAAEAQARRERDARMKAERELQEQREAAQRAEAERKAAEERRAAEEREAKARAERAPDKEKLAAFREAFEALHRPTLTSPRGVEAMKAIDYACNQFLGVLRVCDQALS